MSLPFISSTKGTSKVDKLLAVSSKTKYSTHETTTEEFLDNSFISFLLAENVVPKILPPKKYKCKMITFIMPSETDDDIYENPPTKNIGRLNVIDYDAMSEEEMKEYLEEWDKRCEKMKERTKELKKMDEETLNTIIYA